MPHSAQDKKNEYERLVRRLSLPAHRHSVAAAILARRPYAVGDVRLLGGGGVGTVWSLEEGEVLKIYHASRYGFAMLPLIKEEWTTHTLLGRVDFAPTPRLLSCGELDPAQAHGTQAWAVYTKIPGRHLTWENDQPDKNRPLWGHRIAQAAVTFEKALDAVPEKPAFWNRSVKGFFLLPGEERLNAALAPEERAFLENLTSFIEAEAARSGAKKRYLHGDIHIENLLFEPQTTTLRLFDPSVKFDYPESNLRYALPCDPAYAQAFAQTYKQETGIVLNKKLLWAFAALDKFRDIAFKKEGQAKKDLALCLERLTALAPAWQRISARHKTGASFRI